jgi:hypothetical protein
MEDTLAEIASGVLFAFLISLQIVKKIHTWRANKTHKENIYNIIKDEPEIVALKTSELKPTISDELLDQIFEKKIMASRRIIENPIIKRWKLQPHNSLKKLKKKDVDDVAHNLELLSGFSIDEIEEDEHLKKVYSRIKVSSQYAYSLSNTDKKDITVETK